jgi:chromosome partitioning protein
MATIITITNHKGGVGKTTSTASVAAAMRQRGLRVLMIDLDPQANLSQSFGISDPTHTLYKALRGDGPLETEEIDPDFYIVPSSLELAGAEVELSGEAGREYIVSELLEPVAESFDVILLDTPPSLGVLTINALTASDYVFIPMQAEFLAMQGLARLHDVLEKIRKRLNKKLKLGGIFITRINPRKILSRDVLDAITRHYPDLLMPAYIPDNVSLAEAPAKGIDIFRYGPNTKGAAEYMKLADIMIERAKITKQKRK